MAVRRAVGSLRGVASVDAEVSTKKVVVSFDPPITNISAIERTLADAGFPVVGANGRSPLR